MLTINNVALVQPLLFITFLFIKKVRLKVFTVYFINFENINLKCIVYIKDYICVKSNTRCIIKTFMELLNLR